jgi:ABC-2 type transport system permease protein
LTRKLVYELRFALALCSGMLWIFFVLGTYLYRTFGDTSMEAISRLSPDLVMGLLGGMIGAVDPLEVWLMTLFVHPLVLTLLTAATIAVSARALAAEVERGTLDLLLSCPVPRWSVVAAAILTLHSVQAVMVGGLWFAMGTGIRIGGFEPPRSLERFALLSVNLWLLFFAIGGVAIAVSSLANEQTKAVGRSIAFVVVSFFLNLLASLWPRVRAIDVISVFHYHQPQPLIAEGVDPWRDWLVLLAVGIAGHVVGLFAFQRRDIAAA